MLMLEGQRASRLVVNGLLTESDQFLTRDRVTLRAPHMTPKAPAPQEPGLSLLRELGLELDGGTEGASPRPGGRAASTESRRRCLAGVGSHISTARVWKLFYYARATSEHGR